MYKILLFPFALLYWLTIEVRYLLYKTGVLKQFSYSTPILSVGNLVVGGAGKTPCILSLTQIFKDQGKKVAVVYRGYKRKSKAEVLEVDLTKEANFFGDEAGLCKFLFPDAHVYVGAKRAKVIARLIDEQQPDIILLDDAFQHLAVQRKADLVLLDASENIGAYQLLPMGRMREPWRALKRASDVVISKTNFQDTTKNLREYVFNKFQIDIELTFSYALHSFCTLENWQNRDFTIYHLDKAKHYSLLCGIAKPAQLFEALVTEIPRENISLHSYADHFAFTEDNINSLKRPILISEKEAIKVKDLDIDKTDIYVVRSKLTWNKKDGEVFEHFRHLFS